MKKILCILMFGLVFCSCSSDEGEEWSKGSIAGSVSDRTTGEPVATVNVTLSPGGRSTVTGSDGSFSFDELDPSDYTILISKEGYTPTTDKITVQAGQPTAAHLLIERIPASITADRTLLDFGEEVATLSFRIVNSGYSDLAYKVEKGDCPWLSVDPETDILGYGKTATIVVKIDRQLLASGNNEAMIVVRSTSGGGNVEVKVKAIGEYRAASAVNTLEASEISATTARLNGEIINEGSPAYTERGFVYDKQPTPTTTACIQKLSSPVNNEKRYSCAIDGLSPTQTYYARTYVVQNGNTIYGNIISFTALQKATTLSTSAVTQISATTATFNASIADAGQPAYTERGFCYSTSGTPTIATNRCRVSGSGTGNYSLQVEGLDYPVTYYVCAYAIQDGQPVYGNTVTFTTEFRSVAVNTSAATEVTESSARLNGTISDVGSPAYTQRGFVYSSTNSQPTIANDKVVQFISTPGAFRETLSGLREGTTYYARAFAMQDGQYVYGNTITFTTGSLPVVETGRVSSLTKTGTYFYQWSATFSGAVTAAGSPAYTERGFVYSNNANEPTVGGSDKVVVSGRGTGVFTANVGNLSDMQTYYVRAYVKVGNKYYYGQSVRFSTF